MSTTKKSDTSITVIYHGMSLTVLYMSNMAGVLQETRTTFPSQAPGFIPGCWWGPCCSSFQFSVLCFCFVCLRPVFFVHNAASVMYCTTPDYLTVTDSIISHAARMKILC